MRYHFFFCLMEYRITLAIDRCSALTFSFLAASWWKIHSHVRVFLSAVFALFHVRYTLSVIVRRCLKSPRFVHICISAKLDLFRCPVRNRKSLPQRRTTLNIFGKEVDLGENLFHKQRVYHQKSINIQLSFRLGRRGTLYREGLINVNRNLHKAVYTEKEG